MKSRDCKLVVLGDSGVGKTSLIHKFVNNVFRADFKATIGADFSSKSMVVDGQNVELQIWDTAGEERFHSVGAAFYRGTNACIIVYDCTQKVSFEKIAKWQDDLCQKSGITDIANFPIILFENKSDLIDNRAIDDQTAELRAKELGRQRFKVSALTGENVEAGFNEIVRLYLKASKDSIQEMPMTIKLKDQPSKKNCC